jgi:spore maturation protein CgeB
VKIVLVGSNGSYNAEYFYCKYLRRLGHEVLFFDQYEGVNKKFLLRLLMTRLKSTRFLTRFLRINRRICDAVGTAEPDLVVVFKGEMLSDSVLESLSENYRLALFYTDTLRFPALLHERLHHFCTVFTAANQHDFYYKLGARRVITVPWACDPELHRRLDDEQKKYPISFVGTFYPSRYGLLRHLGEFRDKTYIFGRLWMLRPVKVLPSVYGEDYVEVINQSLVNLNIHHPKDIEADAPNMRVFELAGCGGFQITDRISSIKQLFAPDVVESYSSVSELKEKLRYYLDAPAEATEKGIKAREDCVRHHTYAQRAKFMLDSA